MSSKMLAMAATMAGALMMFVPSAPLHAQESSMSAGDWCNFNFGHVGCGQLGHGPVYRQPTRVIDPCFLAQNAMRPCGSDQRQTARPAGVDSNIVGAWEVPVAGGYWILKVFGNGTYEFHAEGPGAAPPTAGTFSARNGQWWLKASNGYSDGGTYALSSSGLWLAKGQHGSLVWRRVS